MHETSETVQTGLAPEYPAVSGSTDQLTEIAKLGGR